MKRVILILSFCLFTMGTAGAKEWKDPVTGMEFVFVPGGSFEMGCHAKAGKCDSDEKPVRPVRLDGFWIAKHEVTQGQWKRIMGGNPSRFKKGDNYPVEQVSWDDVREFIRRLNAKSPATFALPSEAQWEYACRSGGKPFRVGTSKGYWINAPDLRLMSGNSWGKKDGYEHTAPVGSFPPNKLGLHDMSGNVWEWVRDKFASYRGASTENPVHEGPGDRRVRRGGSWDNESVHIRCSYRNYSPPYDSDNYIGFRLLKIK